VAGRSSTSGNVHHGAKSIGHDLINGLIPQREDLPAIALDRSVPR
jgi:hypothetical protein